MKVLLVGSGGREHALAWKISQSERCQQLFVASGNAATERLAKTQNIEYKDSLQLVDFALKEGIDITIVGPEAPLVEGIADLFKQHNLSIFAPSQKAAQLEGSKQWCKDFFCQFNIPTANYINVDSLASARLGLQRFDAPVVIKLDGLAAGKGVSIFDNLAAAEQALVDIYQLQPQQRVVIEEFLTGQELSFMVITDGQNILPLATCQDHKPLYDGNTGPNTGGMGAYSPAALINDQLQQTILATVIQPTLDGLSQLGIHYVGFLYAGLMINPKGDIKVLEYNCRLGDPEAQVLLMRLRSDLLQVIDQALHKQLDQVQLDWDSEACLGVVMASEEYPNSPVTGHPIEGAEGGDSEDLRVFQAGTRRVEDRLVNAAGRVLCVCAKADNIQQAQQKAYQRIHTIHWKGCYYRTDIGYLAIAKEHSQTP